MAGVGVDSNDRGFLLTRREARVLVYSSVGEFLDAWGEGYFSDRPHGLTVAPDGTLYCVDVSHEVVFQFTATGKLLRTIGTRGLASDTGYDGSSVASIVRSGPPFNKPTNLAVALERRPVCERRVRQRLCAPLQLVGDARPLVGRTRRWPW